MAHSSFTTPQGERAGYLGRPEGAGPWPGVVAIHEIFGLDQNMRDLSDRLATMGYLTFAPDFFNGGNWRKCMRVAFRELKAGAGEFFPHRNQHEIGIHLFSCLYSNRHNVLPVTELRSSIIARFAR